MVSLVDAASSQPPYAELHCISNFTFLRGASHPEELIERAAELGYQAIALTDECSLAGVVRAHVAAKQHAINLIVGSEFQLEDNLRFVLLATDRKSYGALSHLITVARRRAEKGSYRLTRSIVEANKPKGCLALWLPRHQGQLYSAPDLSLDINGAKWLKKLFPAHLWIAVELLLNGDDKDYLRHLQKIGQSLHVPLCAAGNIHMHSRQRQPLQDTLTAIRLRKPINELGFTLFPNGERHLRSRHRLQTIYPAELLNETIHISSLCKFSLHELRYEYPHELVPANETPQSWLKKLTMSGMKKRWPTQIPQKVIELVENELHLIDELSYEYYFLTVYDIVKFARSQGILCQGRGSAANSAVCYCLAITEVDPDRMQLLFERFISKERDEPPDIDVDFEHERREEVIQYIYTKYGRDRAALAATVICYRPRSAIRDVGKALGMNLDQIERLSKSIYWWDESIQEQVEAAGFTLNNPMIQHLLFLVKQILGFPRHLSQHVGGFVISESLLSHLVPIENASMPNRTVIQWEKDDLESLGLLKIDVLGLGMLSAIRKTLRYISRQLNKPFRVTDIPAEDPAVYKMIQQADTIGVFQIESRAQMSMLPRLRPANYYDLVIEIAIVRPGPIQGEMVHPYLARRNGTEPESYPSEAIRSVLERTKGVPIFQEQVMQIAIVAAGFTPGEADQLRRSMAAWKRKGGLEPYQEKLLNGMKKNNYPESFAVQIFNQIKGFGEYGFPESHSASFALLAYVSSWLKLYHHAEFTCALLNSQPMGFYAPAQLIHDAKRHGVIVLPVDINRSEYDCSLELRDDIKTTLIEKNKYALRLGFRMVKDLQSSKGDDIARERKLNAFGDIKDLVARVKLSKKDIEALAAADTLKSLSGHRHNAYWDVRGVEPPTPLLQQPTFQETSVMLNKPTEGQEVIADYSTVGLSLRQHPIALIREHLTAQGIKRADELWQLPNNALVTIAGIVIGRQRPGTASGVMFVTLEDETGYSNLVVWPTIAEQYRHPLLQSNVLSARGKIQKADNVLHIITYHLSDISQRINALKTRSRDFC